MFNTNKKGQKTLNKLFSSLTIFSLVLQSLSGIFFITPAYSQEITPTPTPEIINTPTPESTNIPTPTDTPTITPTPTEEVLPTPTGEITPTPTVEVSPIDTVTPTPETSANPPPQTADLNNPQTSIESAKLAEITPEVTPTSIPSQWTFEKVELNKEYIAPQNSGVKLTFTKLPDPSGNIKIEEITLTQEQILQTGSLSDKAYDITSDMTDGDFTYNLSLPIPEASKGKAVEVKFAETVSELSKISDVIESTQKVGGDVVVQGLSHLTLFIITGTTPPSASNIIDDGDANFSTNGSWNNYAAGINGDHQYIANTAGNWARWTFTDEQLPVTGKTYTISTHWVVWNDHVTNATYRLYDSSGTVIGVSLGVVDQNKMANGTDASNGTLSGWYTFSGIFTLQNGYYVQLETDGSNSFNIVADAIKIETTGLLSEVWVDDSWSSQPIGTDLGSDKVIGYNAFSKIQEGITAVSSGGTVNVAAGTYAEQVTINKSLDLIGDGETTTTILAPNTISSTFTNGAGGQMKPVVTIINGVSVNISQLKIDGVGKGNANNQFVGIGLYNAGGSIDHVTITNIKETPLNGDQSGGDAIYAYNADGSSRTLDISTSTISNYQKNGMTLKGAGLSVDVSGNTVIGEGPTSVIGQNGIQVSDGATGTITNNQVSGHVYTPGSWWAVGILVYQSDDITISDNVVSANQAGIYVDQGSNNSVDSNIITGNSNSQVGVMVTKIIHDDVSSPATANTINHNTITGGFTGIWTSYTYGNTYSNNTISNSTGNGIYSWDSDDNIFSGNNISGVHNADNGGWGIALDGGDTSGTIGSDSNTVSNNTVETSDVGIWVGNGSDDNTFTNNILSGNRTGAQVDKYADYGGANVAPTGLQFHTNSFMGNTQGFINNTTVVTDATSNWWGDASGPLDNKSLPSTPNYNNPSGTGNSVTSYVDYKPWFTNSAMATLSSANAITVAASVITLASATLNGINGNYDASNTSFWWGTTSVGPFTAAVDASSQFPSGWTHDTGLGAKLADGSFSEALTGLTSGTTYYFAAWSEVGGTWYPGEILNFTTVSSDTTAPATPTLISPIDGIYRHTSDSNKSDWTDETDTSTPVVYYYESSLSTTTNFDRSFASTAYKSSALTDSEIMNPGEPEVTYYWHVKACDNVGNCSDWSDPWAIHIDNTVPTQPSGLKFQSQDRTQDFACGTYVPLQVAIPDWNDITGDPTFSHYEYTSFQPNGSVGLNEQILTVSELDNSWMPPADGAYGYAVRSVDLAGNKSDWALSAKTLDGSCQIIYDSTGSITVIKVDNLNSGQDFTFNYTPMGSATTQFILDDDNNTDVTYSDTNIISNLSSGFYTINEVTTPGWSPSIVECTSNYNLNGFPQYNHWYGTMSTALRAGEDLVCTYENVRDTGTLQVFKNVDLNGDGDYIDSGETGATDWLWQVDGGSDHYTGDNAITLPTGTYPLMETNQTNFHPTGLSCTPLYSVDGSDITITKDANVVCTYYNVRDTGSLTIHKVIDADGDLATTNDQTDGDNWEFTVAGNGGDTNLLTSQLSGTNGIATFNLLKTGGYNVTETSQDGYDLVDAYCGITHSDENTVYGVDVTTDGASCTFYNTPNGTIHGYKWDDVDASGGPINGQGEELLSGWTINLYQWNGDGYDSNPIRSMVTNDGVEHFGWYWFEHLFPGQYKVCEVLQSGWNQTYPINENDNCHVVNLPDDNSDEFPTAFNYVAGHEYNFGNFKLGEISGWKWDDYNGNGLWDEGEPALSDWEICLEQEVEPSPSPTPGEDSIARFATVSNKTCILTGSDGRYEFTGLLAGNYRLTETAQLGWKQTWPNSLNYYDLVINSGSVYGGELCYGQPRVNAELTDRIQQLFCTNFGNELQPITLTLNKINNILGSMAPGGTVTYTLTVTNTSKIIAHDVSLRDTLPLGFSYVASSTTGVSEPTVSGQNIVWSLGDLDPDESVIFTYQTNIDSGLQEGNYPNVALAWGYNRQAEIDQVVSDREVTYTTPAWSWVNLIPGVGFSASIGGTFTQVLGASTGQVLGAATGSETYWLVLAIAMIIGGFLLINRKRFIK